MRVVFWYLKCLLLLSVFCYAESNEGEIAFRVIETGGEDEGSGAENEGGRVEVVQVSNATELVGNEVEEEAPHAGILKLAVPSKEHDAERGEYPWIVGYMTTKLYEEEAGNFEYWSDHCGGTLIAPRWVLTVAHCFGRSYSAADYTVFAGGVNFDLRQSVGAYYQQRGVVRVIPHENFDLDNVVADGDVLYQSKSHEFDVALMQLVMPFDVRSGDVAMARISFRKVEGTMTCKIFGWGEVVTNQKTEDYLDKLDVEPSKIDFPKNLTKNLRYKEVLVKSIDTCATEYDLRIPKSIICVTSSGTPSEGPRLRTCVGDPGLPLVCSRINTPDVAELVGVSLWIKEYLRCMTYTPQYLWLGHLEDWLYEKVLPFKEIGVRLGKDGNDMDGPRNSGVKSNSLTYKWSVLMLSVIVLSFKCIYS